jgi:hypothetical protein
MTVFNDTNKVPIFDPTRVVRIYHAKARTIIIDNRLLRKDSSIAIVFSLGMRPDTIFPFGILGIIQITALLIWDNAYDSMRTDCGSTGKMPRYWDDRTGWSARQSTLIRHPYARSAVERLVEGFEAKAASRFEGYNVFAVMEPLMCPSKRPCID